MRTTGAEESGRTHPREKNESNSYGKVGGDPAMNEAKFRTAPFDVFRAFSDGSVLWIGSAMSEAEAKALAQESGVHSPGEYLLLNHITGNRSIVRENGVNGTHGGDGSQIIGLTGH